MKVYKINLSEKLKVVQLHIFADLHIGDAYCNIEEIKNNINYVAKTKNAYAILNGDLINNATKTSVSDCYSENLTPQQQSDKIIELFQPIKNKILVITDGNHEKRTYRADGIKLMKIVADKLGVENYSEDSAIIFLKFGLDNKTKEKELYSIYVTHGCGGGKRPGGKVNRLEEMSNKTDCDIYIHSHTHLPMIFKEGFIRTDHDKQTTEIVDKLFINTSAMLKYGGYGEAFEFSPSSMANPVLMLSGNIKESKAIL